MSSAAEGAEEELWEELRCLEREEEREEDMSREGAGYVANKA